jgi:hypothetical protein
MTLNMEASTDNDGRFKFGRVPPGIARVWRRREVAGGGFTNGATVGEEVRPGETAQVTIGGPGRPVVGRLLAPKGMDGQINWGGNLFGTVYGESGPLPLFPTAAQRTKWDDANAKLPRFPVPVDADGRFRVEDMPAGSYVLGVSVMSRPPGGDGSPVKQIATVTQRFTIPEIQGGRTETPLDLGELQMKSP